MIDHVLYGKEDADAPSSIKDQNGDIVLGLCKVCGKGEIELEQPCSPKPRRMQAGAFLRQIAAASELELRMTAKMQELEKLGVVRHEYQDSWTVLDRKAFDAAMGVNLSTLRDVFFASALAGMKSARKESDRPECSAPPIPHCTSLNHPTTEGTLLPMNTKPTYAITDLFTEDELKRAFGIIDKHNGTNGLNAMLIDGVVTPALPRINEKTGRQNDTGYLAYALQYAYQIQSLVDTGDSSTFGDTSSPFDAVVGTFSPNGYVPKGDGSFTRDPLFVICQQLCDISKDSQGSIGDGWYRAEVVYEVKGGTAVKLDGLLIRRMPEKR